MSSGHAVEHTILEGWIEELEGQRDKAVDAATADRFIAFAQDLIAIGGQRNPLWPEVALARLGEAEVRRWSATRPTFVRSGA
jgi:hypothetical protein